MWLCGRNPHLNFLRSTVFRDVMMCSLVGVYQCVLQEYAGCLLGIFFSPEDGDSMFLRNISNHLLDCEKLKSNLLKDLYLFYSEKLILNILSTFNALAAYYFHYFIHVWYKYNY